VDPVGTQALGTPGILVDKTGDPMTLDQIDQAPGMNFVDRGGVRAKQNASGIGGPDPLRELSFELCRRLRRKLKIEPAPMLDFGHDHRLPPRRSR
jgi:hypothetical protein